MLSYYDRKKEVTLQCDYLEKGRGVALVKEGMPILFASKALIDDKNDFAPIERETLGVVYGIQKFHHYLYGQWFTVECDHKPLSQISRKNLSLALPQLRGMLIMTLYCVIDQEERWFCQTHLADLVSQINQRSMEQQLEYSLW